ncbi:hypothetical protein GCM10009681_39570 [Luedemannella helvata]|uniref:Carbohydrate kinase PfkB domain-containing protein n=1 Tax=Luedemannella helvata TaxID=349315 RepID=A0ABP4WWA4_9ACTN
MRPARRGGQLPVGQRRPARAARVPAAQVAQYAGQVGEGVHRVDAACEILMRVDGISVVGASHVVSCRSGPESDTWPDWDAPARCRGLVRARGAGPGTNVASMVARLARPRPRSWTRLDS